MVKKLCFFTGDLGVRGFGGSVGRGKVGQMKIQQMAFMLVAVFFFFALVGLFFIRFELKDIDAGADELNKVAAISSLEVIASMPELRYDGCEVELCLDEDKLKVMAGMDYSRFWPVASVRVYKIYPRPDEFKKCPGGDCNYYEVWDNGQSNLRGYPTFVSVCKKVSDGGYIYERCDIAILEVGMKIYED